MDLRAYYRKIRQIEAGIEEPVVVIVSRETPDGGKPGVKTDVGRETAARLIVEEKAVLATPEESARFRSESQANWKAAHQASTLSEPDIQALRTALRPQKKS